MLLLVGLGLYVFFPGTLMGLRDLSSLKEKATIMDTLDYLPEKTKKIKFADEENFFSFPGQEDLVEDGLLTYVRDEVLVDVDLDAFDKSVFKKYGGLIVGQCNDFGGYQVQFPNSSLEDLEKISEELNGEEGVISARVNYILPAKTNDFPYPDDHFKLPEVFGKKYNKDSLWEGYNKEEGFEKSFKDKKWLNRVKFSGNPYWGYQATNLPYLWDATDRDKTIKITVMDAAFTFTNVQDVDMTNLDLGPIFDKMNASKKKDMDIDIEGTLEKEGRPKTPWEMSQKEIKKVQRDYNKSGKGHVYEVCSLAGAKANNIGFTGTALNTKLMTMPYLNNLAPYLMSFSLGQNKDGIPDIFNISMGYDDIILYCLNADEERIKEDLRNKKFRKDLNINKMFREKNFFNKPFSKKKYDRDIEEVYKALVTYKKTFEANEKSLATALDKELDKKDFIIVQSAGNSNKIIQKLEHDYGLNINHTSYFHYADQRLKDRVLIVGASSPNFEENNGYIETYFSNRSTRKNVDIVAPGSNMPGYNVYGDFVMWEGTSAAAPFISGIIVNMCSQVDRITGAELKSLIVDSGNIPAIDKNGNRNSKLIDCKKLMDRITGAKLKKKEEKITIEATKKDLKAEKKIHPEKLLERMYGTWRDIDHSFKAPDPHGDIRTTISKEKIAFYYNDSDVSVFGKYEVLDYDEENKTIKIKARLKKYLDGFDLAENKSTYLNSPDYKNVKVYDLYEVDPGELLFFEPVSEKQSTEKDTDGRIPGEPLTEEEIDKRIANDEDSLFILEYDEVYTIKLIDNENMTITDDEGVTNYKYLFGLDEYDF